MKRRESTGNVMESTQPVQMGGGVNPNWWSIRPPPVTTSITNYYQQQQYHPPNYNNFLPLNPPSSPNSIVLSPYPPQSSSSSNSSSWHEQDHHQQLPSQTWSQHVLGGMQSAATAALTQQYQISANNKMKFQNWEHQSQMIIQQQQLHDQNHDSTNSTVDIKQEHHSVPISASCYNDMFNQENEAFFDARTATTVWSSTVIPNSSPPKSCVTSFGSNNNSMLDFSSIKEDGIRHPTPDCPSESNSKSPGGATKKARVQQSPPQSNTLKVRKERLGDRITTLHQLVSPFGKTDTASVLLEAMGYIRFLQSQIEALSLPYLGSGSESTRQHQQQQQQMNGQGGERNCLFPEHPGQLLNDNCTKSKASSDLQESSTEKGPKRDLRSRGLCLVPVSCTQQVGSDNGADYWVPPPPAFGSGGFH